MSAAPADRAPRGAAEVSPALPASDPRRVVPALLAGLGLVAVVYALVGVSAGPLEDVRIVVTSVFLLLGPGWAIAGYLHGRSMAERFVLSAATGAAVAILVGQTMAVAEIWYPVGALVALTAPTVPVLVAHAVHAR